MRQQKSGLKAKLLWNCLHCALDSFFSLSLSHFSFFFSFALLCSHFIFDVIAASIHARTLSSFVLLDFDLLCVCIFLSLLFFGTDFFCLLVGCCCCCCCVCCRLMPQQAPLICHFVFMAHFTFRQSGAHPLLSLSPRFFLLFALLLTHTVIERERDIHAHFVVNVNNKSIRWERNACNTHIIQFEMHTLMTWSYKMPNEKSKKKRTRARTHREIHVKTYKEIHDTQKKTNVENTLLWRLVSMFFWRICMKKS